MNFIGTSNKANGILHLLFILFSILLVTGCMSQKVWKYGVSPESILPVVIDISVSVPPFKDYRLNKNSNMFAMYLIPLMPFGWQTYNTPEGAQMHMNSGMWLWRPNEDIAKATAEELNAAHIFKEVFFTHRESEGDLILQGEIQSTKYKGKLLSYGLSAYGPLLWFIGFPSSTISNELILSFTLKDRTNNVVLWQKDYQEEIGKWTWIYYIQSDFEYSEMLKEVLQDVVKELRLNLNSIKTSLKINSL
jgi:hypothetical protein